MHQWDIHTYASHYWHPVAATSHLQPGEVLAITMLDQPLLLTWPTGEPPRAFRNRCPIAVLHFGKAEERGSPVDAWFVLTTAGPTTCAESFWQRRVKPILGRTLTGRDGGCKSLPAASMAH